MLPYEIRKKFPWFKTVEVGAGCLGLSGEGWFDAPTALKAIRTKAESLGTQYIGVEIKKIHRHGDRIVAVETDQGELFDTDIVINAAGAKAGLVARMAGIDAPIESRKRCAFVFRSSTHVETFTNLIDTTFANRTDEQRIYIDICHSGGGISQHPSQRNSGIGHGGRIQRWLSPNTGKEGSNAKPGEQP